MNDGFPAGHDGRRDRRSAEMALNLIKLAVGIDDPAHLAGIQARRLADSARSGSGGRLWHVTRNTPRRAAELLDGGSIYWVIKGRIRLRQRLIAVETDVDEDGRRFCRLVLDPRLVETEAWPHRPIQGWRYLEQTDAPPDRRASGEDGRLPAEIAAELRELGLL